MSASSRAPPRQETDASLSSNLLAILCGASDLRLARAVVKSLRRKLGDNAANPAYVRNDRGVGYRRPRPGEQ